MSKFDKNMNEFFQIVPVDLINEIAKVEPDNISVPITTDKQEKDLNQDYENVRSGYKDLIRTGSEAIDELRDIARESEHPRAYEVLATLIKNVSDVGDRLMNIHKQVKDTKKSDVVKTTVNVDKAIMFHGSTADLSKMINDAKKKEIE